ncbi:MAG: hypothetical protein ACTS4U_01165 [Candidatus Hodgkinia cicadicola]
MVVAFISHEASTRERERRRAATLRVERWLFLSLAQLLDVYWCFRAKWRMT